MLHRWGFEKTRFKPIHIHASIGAQGAQHHTAYIFCPNFSRFFFFFFRIFANNMQALGKLSIKAAMTIHGSRRLGSYHFLIQYVVAAPPEPNFYFTHTHTFSLSYLFYFLKFQSSCPPLEMSFNLEPSWDLAAA